MLIASKSKTDVDATKSILSEEFDMKDLGAARKILGMEIERDRDAGILKLRQSSYIKKVLSTYSMDQCKHVSTPLAAHFKLSSRDSPCTEEEQAKMSHVPYANAVGSLMYMMVCTRPDLGYAVSLVSRYLSSPGIKHWEGVKWILRYLKGTSHVGLVFGGTDETKHVVTGYVDADYAKDWDSGRSVTGYGFTVRGGLVSWKSSLQRVVALSSTESEYIALTEAAKEALWLKGFVSELGVDVQETMVWCDNMSALQLAKNPVYHERTKHVDVRLHFIRDVVKSRQLSVEYVDTHNNPADMMTKVVGGVKFRFCCNKWNVA